MGYATLQAPQKTHRANSVCLEKSASGDFFEEALKLSLENRRQPLKPRRKIEPTPTKTAQGVLYEHYRYTAFGEAEIYNTQGQKLAESAIDNDVLWNSRRFDGETGLYYYKYRHYKSDIGRWLGRDPIEEAGGVNLYAFAGNEAVNGFDSLGLCTIGGTTTLGGVIVACVNGDEDTQTCSTTTGGGEKKEDEKKEEKKIRTLNIIIRRDSSYTKENFEKRFFNTQHIRVLKKVLKSCDERFSIGEIKVSHRFELDKQVLDGKKGYGKGNQQIKNFRAAGASKSPNIYVLGTKYPLIGPDGSRDVAGLAMKGSAVVMKPRSSAVTLSHEIGHVIGYDGGDIEGGHHSSGADNLMSQHGGITPDKNWCAKMNKFLK